MRKTLLLLIFPALILTQANCTNFHQTAKAEIKSLSEADVQNYLNGRGMGLAKPAELNSFPGPMHVLENAAQLELTDAQKIETQKIYDNMHAEASRVGKLIVDKEAELNRLFASSTVTEENLSATVKEISALQGELRIIHLRAHLALKNTLSPAQIEKYNDLRGYNGKSGGHHGH